MDMTTADKASAVLAAIAAIPGPLEAVRYEHRADGAPIDVWRLRSVPMDCTIADDLTGATAKALVELHSYAGEVAAAYVDLSDRVAALAATLNHGAVPRRARQRRDTQPPPACAAGAAPAATTTAQPPPGAIVFVDAITSGAIVHDPYCHATVPTPERPSGGCICGAFERAKVKPPVAPINAGGGGGSGGGVTVIIEPIAAPAAVPSVVADGPVRVDTRARIPLGSGAALTDFPIVAGGTVGNMLATCEGEIRAGRWVMLFQWAGAEAGIVGRDGHLMYRRAGRGYLWSTLSTLVAGDITRAMLAENAQVIGADIERARYLAVPTPAPPPSSLDKVLAHEVWHKGRWSLTDEGRKALGIVVDTPVGIIAPSPEGIAAAGRKLAAVADVLTEVRGAIGSILTLATDVDAAGKMVIPPDSRAQFATLVQVRDMLADALEVARNPDAREPPIAQPAAQADDTGTAQDKPK